MDWDRKEKREKIRSKGYNVSDKSVALTRDPEIGRIITELAKELGFTEVQVWGALHHFFTWQRNSLSNAEYADYLWPRCVKIKWFNREGGKDADPGWEEYDRSKKLMDKNRLKRSERGSVFTIPEDKKEIIDSIKVFSPLAMWKLSYKARRKYRKFAWKIEGEVQESGWNIRSLSKANNSLLEELLAVLQQLDKLDEQSN